MMFIEESLSDIVTKSKMVKKMKIALDYQDLSKCLRFFALEIINNICSIPLDDIAFLSVIGSKTSWLE
jgi:hypothetical protein